MVGHTCAIRISALSAAAEPPKCPLEPALIAPLLPNSSLPLLAPTPQPWMRNRCPESDVPIAPSNFCYTECRGRVVRRMPKPNFGINDLLTTLNVYTQPQSISESVKWSVEALDSELLIVWVNLGESSKLQSSKFFLFDMRP